MKIWVRVAEDHDPARARQEAQETVRILRDQGYQIEDIQVIDGREGTLRVKALISGTKSSR